MTSPTTAASGATSQIPLTVYEPPKHFLPPLRPYFREVRTRWAFMRELARTDLKAKHYDTFFGQIWLILSPLLMAAVWLLVREVIRPAGNEENRSDIIAHLILGVFMFNYGASVISGGITSVIRRKGFILNTNFPRMVFPISDLMRALVELVPVVIVYSVLNVLLAQPITWNLLWFPVIVALQTVFVFGFGLLLGTMNVFVRDVSNLMRPLIRLWMFCSPILYTVEEIPAHLLPYLQLNPLFPFFAAYENIFDGVPPEPKYLLWGLGWGLLALLVGAVAFLRKERDFAIWL